MQELLKSGLTMAERNLVTEAFILKIKNLKEQDRSFYFFSKDYGLGIATAYGGCRSKSRFCSTIQPFNKVKLFLYKNKGHDSYKLSDVTDISNNESYRKSIEGIYLFSFFSEVYLSHFILPEEYKAYFYLLLYSFDLYNVTNDVKVTINFFISKLIYLHGERFNFNSCCQCASEEEILFFNYYENGLLCKRHYKEIRYNNDIKNSQYPLNSIERGYLNKFFYDKYTDLKELNFDNTAMKKIFGLLSNLIEIIFEKRYNSLNELVKIV